jgi:hypothetical protein
MDESKFGDLAIEAGSSFIRKLINISSEREMFSSLCKS